MPTATAASSADSRATRLRNLDARSSVWRISGRPLLSDSTRTPCRSRVRICACAHSTNWRTLGSSARAVPRPATARRNVTRLVGCTSPVASRSASLSITRGENAAMPTPRSGSATMTAAIRRLASPKDNASPTLSCSALSTPGSTQTLPRGGAPFCAAGGACSTTATVTCPRSGYASLTALTLTSLEAPPCASAARPMLGNPSDVAVRRPSARACCANSTGVGWSEATIASPPSSWWASRSSPASMRSAKNPTAVSAATASITATTSSRSSPALKSRTDWRAASVQVEGRRAATVSALMGRRGAGPVRTQRSAPRRGGGAPAAPGLRYKAGASSGS